MSDALLDRYAAVERLYSQGQWEQVLQASNALLAELPPEPSDPWRARLLLLQGHTHLYGLAQFEKAAAIYQQVLDARPEPVLQNVAEQELARCQEALAAAPATSAAATPEPAAITTPSQPALAAPQAPAPTPLSQEFPFTAQAMGSPPPGQAVSAMPWLAVLGGVDPAAAQLEAANKGGSSSDSAANPFVAAPTTPTQTAADSATLPSEVTATAPDETEPAPEAVVEGDTEVEQSVAVAVEAELEPEAAAAPEAEPQPEPAAEAAFSVDAPSDVIDEPDQVEVRQADARSAELIDLEPIDSPEQSEAAAPPRWSPAEEAELARGLLTVVLS